LADFEGVGRRWSGLSEESRGVTMKKEVKLIGGEGVRERGTE